MFENILCVQTTATLKKSALEKILGVLQEFMRKINDSAPVKDMIHYESDVTKMYAINVNLFSLSFLNS